MKWVGLGGLIVAHLMMSSGPATASAAKTRTVLVYDNSGSMRTSDPRRLAAAAALLYVQLAKKGDEVGLVVFDKTARVAVPLHPNPRQSTFARALGRLRLNGPTTDIGRALDEALVELGPPAPGVKNVVVLMTDGKVDLGKARRLELPAEHQRIRTTVVQRYRARGVPVYSIAFTEAADRRLLGEVAGRTQGAFRYIKTPQSLHRAFSEMFVVASGSSSLPIRDGAVVVDSSVKQTSLVMTKTGPNAGNKVVAPDEEVLDAKSRRAGVKWKSSSSYDLVELETPQAGAWQMMDKDGKAPEALAIVKDSSLDLEVTYGPKDATVDDTLQFKVQLTENGKRISSFSRLKNLSVEAKIEGSDGTTRTVLFEATDKPGLFQGRINNAAIGQHTITVTAISPALQRQWRGNYAILPRCFEHKVKTDGAQPVAMVRMAKLCPQYDDLRIEVARKLKGKMPKWMPLESISEGLYGLRLEPLGPGERGEAHLRIAAKTKDGYDISIMPEPIGLPEAPKGQWMAVVGERLAYINIPLFGLVAIAFLIRRSMTYSPELPDD